MGSEFKDSVLLVLLIVSIAEHTTGLVKLLLDKQNAPFFTI